MTTCTCRPHWHESGSHAPKHPRPDGDQSIGETVLARATTGTGVAPTPRPRIILGWLFLAGVVPLATVAFLAAVLGLRTG